MTQLDPNVEAYLHRPPFLQNLVLLDADGNILDFSVSTDPHLLSLHTRIGNFIIAFQDVHTFAVGLPERTVCGLRFRVSPLYWKAADNFGIFHEIRNLNYQVNGRVIRNQITPNEGGYDADLLIDSKEDSSLSICIYPSELNPSQPKPFSAIRIEAKNRWLDWFSRVPDVDPIYFKSYAYAWWVMANNLISPQGNILYEAMIPSKLGYVGLWLWDSAMHTLAYRHIDPELARNQIRVLLAHQLSNGMLPDVVFDEGIVTTLDHPLPGEVTKPPIIAWAAWKIHEISPDLKFLSEIYDPLVQLNNWWFTCNDDDHDGMVQYNHPYSSGLDDSPLWDQGMPVESPDLNTYLYLHMNSLSSIAEALEKTDDAKMWSARAAKMVPLMIEHFWEPKTGLFWAQKDHKSIKVVTPFNLYPLWTGQLSPDIRSRLIEHIRDPEMFWGSLMLPTVARSDPAYQPATMWRGPVWTNINYFFIEALNKVGETDLARTLRNKTLEMIMAHKGMFEYYDADTGAPPSKALNTFGWTSAVFIDLALQASREMDQ